MDLGTGYLLLYAELKHFSPSGQRVREVSLDSSSDGDRERSSRTLVCRYVLMCKQLGGELFQVFTFIFFPPQAK